VPSMEYSGLASPLDDSHPGGAFFAWMGYPAQLQAAMDDPVVDGYSSEKIR